MNCIKKYTLSDKTTKYLVLTKERKDSEALTVVYINNKPIILGVGLQSEESIQTLDGPSHYWRSKSEKFINGNIIKDIGLDTLEDAKKLLKLYEEEFPKIENNEIVYPLTSTLS